MGYSKIFSFGSVPKSLSPITILITITLLLAFFSAFFSIFGLSKLFIGGSILLIIGFSILEVAKIVIVSTLNQKWKIIPVLIKSYLIAGVVILMIITSMGIFGYLSNAYITTSNSISIIDNKISLLNSKIDLLVDNKTRIIHQVEIKNNRISQLSSMNQLQESRIDSMYNRHLYANAKRIELITKETNNDINELYTNINELNNELTIVEDSITSIKSNIIELQNNTTTSNDIGPLKYIAISLGIPIDNLVKYLIFLLMLVFDPLAIALVLTINVLIKSKKPREPETILTKETTPSGLDIIRETPVESKITKPSKPVKLNMRWSPLTSWKSRR